MPSADPPPRRRSLTTRWLAALLFTGALPLALLGLSTLRIQRRGLEVAEKRHEVAVTDHVAQLVGWTLLDAAETTRRVGRLLTLELGPDSLDQRLQLARHEVSTTATLNQVAVYSDQGALVDAINRTGVASVPPPEHLPLLPGELSQLGAEGHWLSPEGDPPQLRFVAPLLSAGAHKGFLLGTLAPDALRGPLLSIARDRFEDPDGAVLLLDQRGQILAGASGGERALGDAPLHPEKFAQDFAQTVEFESDRGEAMVGTLRTLPSRRWAVVVRNPARSVFAALRPARRSLLLSALGFLSLAALLGVWLARRTTAPVRALMAQVAAYGRRDFSARAAVRTGDELQELGEALAGMADALSRGEAEITRRAAVEAALARFLPEGVVRSVVADGSDLKLGGARRQVTVLFADVVSFTSFAEQAPPEQVVAFLNELFSVLTEVIFRHGGTVDKFIGDSVMALFGVPTEQPDHTARALYAAEDMHRFVEASAASWRERFGITAQLAIGVNSGEAVVGNLGSERRMEYTAIGDVVNTAARLEALARGGQTLLTADTAQAVGQGFLLVSLGERPLRGKQRPVELFELGGARG